MSTTRLVFCVVLLLATVGVVAHWPGLAWAGGIVVGAVGWEIIRETWADARAAGEGDT